MGRRFAAVLGTVAAAGLVLCAAAPPASADVTSKRSLYWAGYVAYNPDVETSDFFKYVTATFTVPSIKTSCQAADYNAVSQLVGLSGSWVQSFEFPLQAAGVYETCASGSPVYSAAYWNVPANGANDDQPGQMDGPTLLFPVSPGDVVFASVYLLPPCPSGSLGCLEYVRFTVTDQTTGQTWQQKVACDTNDVGSRGIRCDTVTAEVVTQADVNATGGGNATPDFGSVRFTQVKVTDLNQTGAKAMVNSQWTTYKITEYGTRTVRPDVVPGPLTNTTNPSQSAFTNTWKRLN
jgi:hypothetical protein